MYIKSLIHLDGDSLVRLKRTQSGCLHNGNIEEIFKLTKIDKAIFRDNKTLHVVAIVEKKMFVHQNILDVLR